MQALDSPKNAVAKNTGKFILAALYVYYVL